jgi:hypothetical protein
MHRSAETTLQGSAPTSRAFVAAGGKKQWLLDVGRMDLDVRKDSAKARAFREAAQVFSPVSAGSAFRLHWGQGIEDVVVDSFAVHNGRIVLRVIGSPALGRAGRRSTAHSMRAWRSCAIRSTPCRRISSAGSVPAARSGKIAMICSVVKCAFFMGLPSRR